MSFTSHESSAGQYNPYPPQNDFSRNLEEHRRDVNQYEINKKNELDEIEKNKEALYNGFFTSQVHLDNPAAIYGWIQGLIDGVNQINEKIKRYNNTYNPQIKYARLTIDYTGKYEINYDSDDHYLYRRTNIETPPYYIEFKAAFGGKRAKSKKRTKSRKIKKNAKKSKTRKR